MLVTMTPGEPVQCNEHGVIGPASDGSVGGNLGAGVVALLHLRDVHGKDVEGALRKVQEQLKAETPS